MSGLYKLYDYQEKAISLLRDSFRKGLTRPVLQAPTGAGKTVIFSHIVASALDKGKKVLVIVPFLSLIEQTHKFFQKCGIPMAGIIQGQHPLTNSKKRLQIGTIQSLARRGFPEVDLIIFDECHLTYESFTNHISKVNTPVIGVTATPWAKGMGKHYNNLLKPVSMQELMDKNYLSEYIAYAPCEPDMSGVKTSKGDYEETETGKRMSTAKITGSITKTWLELGNNEPTICFCVNVAHAGHVGAAFDKIGISNAVITASTDKEEREELFEKFNKREVTILINIATLIAGLDVDCRCIIYARPTKSEIRLVQCIGRGLRTADGKERMILLDHSGSISKLGFPEDIDHNELDCGEKKTIETKKKESEEREERLPKECPKCDALKPVGENKCPFCEFEPRATENVEVIEGTLSQVKGKTTKIDKQYIWSQLKGYQFEQRFKGKIKADGWVKHTFKEITGVWPRNMKDESCEPSESILGFIKHKNIKWARRKNANKSKAN